MPWSIPEATPHLSLPGLPPPAPSRSPMQRPSRQRRSGQEPSLWVCSSPPKAGKQEERGLCTGEGSGSASALSGARRPRAEPGGEGTDSLQSRGPSPFPVQVCWQDAPGAGWAFTGAGPWCVGAANGSAPRGGLWSLLLGCMRAARELLSHVGRAASGDEAFGLRRQHREHSELPGFVH